MADFVIKGRRGQHKNLRAKQRNAARKAENLAKAKLIKKVTPQQQLEKLDFRLGKGVGAIKERKKIAEKIQAEAEKA